MSFEDLFKDFVLKRAKRKNTNMTILRRSFYNSHFYEEDLSMPIDGIMPSQALNFLKVNFPNEIWKMIRLAKSTQTDALMELIQNNKDIKGTVGSRIDWEFINTDDLNLRKTEVDFSEDNYYTHWWTGVIKVTIDKKESFYLYSYLDSQGMVGQFFFISTDKTDLFTIFLYECVIEKEKREHQENKIKVQIYGNNNYYIDKTPEIIYINEETQKDIDLQALNFFQNKSMYESLKIDYRRGLLFVGPPGNGKTMMVRHILRICDKFNPNVWMIKPDQYDSDYQHALNTISKKTPAIVILEEIDQLIHDKNSKYQFLSALDGIKSLEGVLFIATTNHPENIDKSLLHRPSRFDRVWHFNCPEDKLRKRYIKDIFPNISDSLLETLNKNTSQWSFAYLNELKVSASIYSIYNKVDINDETIQQAFDILEDQFKKGKEGHIEDEPVGKVGFL